MSTEFLQDDLTSGLETTPQLDASPPSLRVRSIRFDSGMRGTGLRPADLIVAVNGKPVERPATPEALQKVSSTLVGQYAESQAWTAAGLSDGAPLSLTVRRRNYPGVGWTELELHGELRNTRSWRDGANEPVMGSSGPQEMASDGFDGSWSGWYEQFARQLNNVLDGGMQQQNFTSRYEVQQLLAQKPRVDFLVSHYRGALSAAVKDDFAAALKIASGEVRHITPKDMDYRQEEDQRIRAVSDLAHAAWDDFNKSRQSEFIGPFPAIDPITGNRASITGKLVSLPSIGNANWIEEGHRTWFTIGNRNDGWYIADAESPAALQMLLAAERYRKFVGPSLPGEFAIIGRVLPTPRLVVVDGNGEFGLQVEIAAAMVGDAMFIDLSAPVAEGAETMFAGEEQFHHLAGAMPPDSASPADVMTAMIQAVKHGDQPLWKALFAPWFIEYLPDGRPVINPYEDRAEDMLWELSRREILGIVYAASPVWTGDPRAVMTGQEFPLAPVIEEVDVEIEHVGLFDTEYRTFTGNSLNRFWQLQRRDHGPWRISSVQNL